MKWMWWRKEVSEKEKKQMNGGEEKSKDSVPVLSTIGVSSHNEVICYHWNDDWTQLPLLDWNEMRWVDGKIKNKSENRSFDLFGMLVQGIKRKRDEENEKKSVSLSLEINDQSVFYIVEIFLLPPSVSIL